MCLADLRGRLLQVNDKMTTIFGYPRQELEGMTVNDLAYPDDLDLSPEFIAHAVQGDGDSAPFEKRYRHRRGHLMSAQVASSLVRDGQGQPRYFISQVQDISDRKRYEHELQLARDTAETANRAKSEFLAHMSHEIRTPMNIVPGLAQVLRREQLTATQRDTLGRIQTAGESLLAIINHILDLAKIESGQLRLEPQPVALETLLERLDTLMGAAAQSKRLRFAIEAPPTPLGLLMADAVRLEQVLINLIGNAVKFTEQGEVTLVVQRLRADALGVRLRFEVRDTGIGIPPAAQERLFTPFTQADEGISRRFGGTGLGLSISKRLLALMGEEIGVASQAGQGSTFWFELSLAWAPAAATGVSCAAASHRTSPTPPMAPRLAGMHVLVVDDHAMNRDLLVRALALEGASATLAADGQQALQLLKAGSAAVDAVLMDMRMPVMDGFTATRLIREELGLTELPVIAFTASVLDDQQAAARAAGVNDILAKPLNLEEMAVLLTKWVKPRPAASTAGAAAAPGQPPPATAAVRRRAAAFPDIVGIDRARAAVTLGHNRDLFLWLLRRIADEYATAQAQTRQDLAQGERDQAARRMHTLASNAGSLGALELMALARELEGAIDGV